MPITDESGNDAVAFTSTAVAVLIHYTLELCDLKTDTFLADLTSAATFTVKPRRSGQPLSIIADLAADNADIRDRSFDGDRNLTKLKRTLKARKDGVLIGHVPVQRIDYTGDENTSTVQITGYDPLYTLKGRPYRDATGNLIDPDIVSPISGASILKDGVANTISNSGPAGDQEGYLPLDATAGDFDETIPPAADLGIELTDWPVQLDELVTLIADTGAVDVWVDPVDTTMGFPAGIVGVLNVTNRRGSDISDTVHFDWGTGAFNARGFRRSDDGDQMQNKLIYYLGPKKDKEHWAGNITATEAGLEAYLALEETSRDAFWTVMRIRVFDDNAADNAARKLYHVLWKEEVRGSVNGQEIVHITPAADCVFEPFVDYMPGDTVGVNIGDHGGPELIGATQRVDGFDVSVDLDGVGQVSELQTLQDN
jgi:hypothetical protein